jgi:hypothetical protein
VVERSCWARERAHWQLMLKVAVPDELPVGRDWNAEPCAHSARLRHSTWPSSLSATRGALYAVEYSADGRCSCAAGAQYEQVNMGLWHARDATVLKSSADPRYSTAHCWQHQCRLLLALPGVYHPSPTQLPQKTK